MNAGCQKKIRRLTANTYSRKRMIGASWRRQAPGMQTHEYRTALLQRYPVGLIDDVEIEALLKSWPRRAIAHRNLA